MPSSQNNQNRCRFVPLFADNAHDPVRGNNGPVNRLFNANTSSVTEPSAIKATLSTASLQGPGLTTIIAMLNGIFETFYAPFTYVPSMGAAASNYRDKHLAIHGDLMGKRSFTLSELPTDIYHQTTPVLTWKPDHLSAHFVANPTATSVGPFDSADESKPEMEKIKSRKSAYLPHNLGSIMSPEDVDGLTVAYFWITVYPVIVSEGTQAEHQHLIQFFQVAATLRSAGGTSVVNHSAFEVVKRDEGVFETVEQCILDRLFPNSNNSGSIDNSGFKEVAKEIGALAASQQKQAEEAEERRQKKEDEKYSFEKVLGPKALKMFKLYNGLNEGISDEALVAKMIPFFEKLSTLKSTKESDILKALQEAMEEVYAYLEVDPEDAVKVTPQMLKALLEHWERIDTDSLVTGVGANLFLHGPRCAKTAEEQIQVFHASLAATNAPEAAVLKQLYSGEIYIPTIADVGYTLRSMMWFFMAVTVPGHPHISSLKKVINKWNGVERKFTSVSVRRCDVAIRVVDMSFNLLCKRTGEWIGDKKDQPIVTENDERFAVAIDAGMVESLLRMLTRFVGQRQYPELRETIYNLLDSVHIVVATRKRRSTRALDSNRGLIEEALLTHERILTGSKDRCILKIVETILSVNRLDSCSQCFEQLEKKDVRRCSRCMIAKYCSRECQVEDWKSGPHKDFCNAAVENARQIKSDGGTDEDVRLKNSILHIKMRGDEIFMKNSVTAVFQAISKGYEILDCIVDVDLRVSPPSIEVMLSEEFLSLDMNKESEMYAVKKMKVDEAREEKCLPFNYIGDEAGMVVLHKQPASSAFPGCVSNLGPSWPKAQETMKQFFCLKGSDDIARMTESVPGLMDEFLEQLFAKRYLREDGSKEGMTKVLKEPTDEDEFMSILGEVLSAMNLAE